MAGTYTLTGKKLTLANQAVTLTFLNPKAAPAKDLIFRRFWIGQSGITAMAQVDVQLNTQVTAFPTLVSATPAPLVGSDVASIISGGTAGAVGTCGINASAEGAGAKTVFWPDVFPNINGWLLIVTPEESIEASAGQASGVGMHLPVATSPLTNWTFGCSWTEA
jgi:hypothetical protein